MNVEQEKRFFSICGVLPARPKMVRHQALHRASEIRIDDDRVRAVAASRGAHSGGAAAGELHRLHSLAEMYADAEPPRHRCHVLRYGAASTNGMKHAGVVLEIREDREQTRATKGRHAQILRLEREGDPYTRILEVPGQVGVQRIPWPQQRQQAHQSRCRHVPPTGECTLEAGPEPFELLTIVGEIAAHVGGVRGRDRSHLALELLDVRRGDQFAAASEDEPVMRVEFPHRNLGPEIESSLLIDLLEHTRIQEECGACIEAESIFSDR